MKSFFTTLLVLCCLTGYSQKLDYTRKYLKTIVRRQMVEIQELKSQNHSLLKLVDDTKVTTQNKVSEQNKLGESSKAAFEKEIINLRVELRFKEREVTEIAKEKETLVQSNALLKRQVELMAMQVAEAKMPTPAVSVQSYALPEREAEYRPARRTYSAPSRSYITGPRGGCYYINGNGNKTYVDRSLCR